ncbi:FecR family protein [Chitinophaga sp. HK235]|uniref:FecR family protein n=1 Tax=Chitinophaga sp. HK235 TaxID=2952571 RepID=UPI001BA5EB10|nr:FecR domain-containing protein [Chitinophaga sp. HK235]
MDYEKIRELTFDELLGTISDEEKALLYNAIEADSQARSIWESIHGDRPRLLADASESFAQHPVEEVLTNLHKRSRILYVRKACSIAAACLLAITGSWYLLRHYTNNGQQPVAALRNNMDSTIRLVTADGKTIDLSADSSGIQVDHTILNNTHQTLSIDARHQTGSGMNTLTVPHGKDYNLLLADGTQVQLNAGTTISFPFSFNGTKREVTVNGEAYFQIAAKAEQPFIVHLPGNTISVLGTAFNINTYDSGSVKVALVEGAVKVASSRQNEVLKPGFEITSSNTGMTTATFDPDKVLSWRTGVYTFENASLQELAPVILRWYGIIVMMDNQRVSSRRFFGIIDRNQPLQAFLHNLEAADGVKSHYDQNGILHFE